MVKRIAPVSREEQKSLMIWLSPADHRQIKQYALDHGITMADAARFALLEPSTWKRAARAVKAAKLARQRASENPE